jgi:hypothetical protein
VNVRSIAMLLAFASAACSGTETGNPSPATSPQLRFAMTPLDAAPAGPTPTIEEAYLGIGPVTALACGAGSTVLTSSVGVTLSLSAPSAAVTVDEVSTCGLTVDLQAQTIGPEGARELASVLIRGTSSDGVPFVISSSASRTLSLVPTAPPLTIDAESQWLLSFEVITWLANVNLAAVVPGPDGIRIDSTSHPELLGPIEARLGMGVALRRDLNRNGQVDPEDVPVALPP